MVDMYIGGKYTNLFAQSQSRNRPHLAGGKIAFSLILYTLKLILQMKDNIFPQDKS